MRVLSAVCRNGHAMAGKNLLWHTRYDKSGGKSMVRECRACANERYRTKRLAQKRNQELEQEAVQRVRGTAEAMPLISAASLSSQGEPGRVRDVPLQMFAAENVDI